MVLLTCLVSYNINLLAIWLWHFPGMPSLPLRMLEQLTHWVAGIAASRAERMTKDINLGYHRLIWLTPAVAYYVLTVVFYVGIERCELFYHSKRPMDYWGVNYWFTPAVVYYVLTVTCILCRNWEMWAVLPRQTSNALLYVCSLISTPLSCFKDFGTSISLKGETNQVLSTNETFPGHTTPVMSNYWCSGHVWTYCHSPHVWHVVTHSLWTLQHQGRLTC